MAIPKRARSGGPKTAAGRAVGSSNALKHGLTAAGAVTVAEADRANALHDALLMQYAPQTPLEKLQIVRIARSAAKLQRLHEVEEAAFRLAQEDALPRVADILAALGPADPAVQEEAVRILQGQGQTSRSDPDDAVLARMCDEIRANSAGVATFDDVRKLLPTVCAFVEARCAQAGTTDPGLQLQALAAVDELLQRYPTRLATLRQAALPPADQADRLMRYQVSLDRQLSKCMGELLQMIALRPPAALP